MRVLNLYAGIGGNRKNLPSDVQVVAVELDPDVAAIYAENFPTDEIVIGDAHQYLLDHYLEFDFIWSSPPCPSHSRIRRMGAEVGSYSPVYPDMKLYEEILFLQNFAKCPFVIENVIPYYTPLIAPSAIRERHMFWSNFHIPSKGSLNASPAPLGHVRTTQERYGFSIKGKKLSQRRDKILRNLVNPKLARFIFDCAFKEKQEVLF